MKRVTVLEGQSLLDLSIQTTGSIESAFDLANLNNASITDTLMTGTSLTAVAVRDIQKFKYYDDNKLKPSTIDFPVFNPLSLFAEEFPEEFE